jgi:hypothetical protein
MIGKDNLQYEVPNNCSLQQHLNLQRPSRITPHIYAQFRKISRIPKYSQNLVKSRYVNYTCALTKIVT